MENLEEMVRRIVKQCIREYSKQIPDCDQTAIYNDVSELLTSYYKDGEKDAAVRYALQAQRFDPYSRIIPLYYRDQQTLDSIASGMGVDVSTIVRNKKRLCMDIYKSIL